MGGWRWTSLAACSAGSPTTKRAPEPCRRSPSVGPVSWIVTSPRCARTISWTIASPRPVLPASWLRASSRRVKRSSRASGRPLGCQARRRPPPAPLGHPRLGPTLDPAGGVAQRVVEQVLDDAAERRGAAAQAAHSSSTTRSRSTSTWPPRRTVDGASASCLPVVKVCIGSSEPFVGVLNWAPPAQPLAADPACPYCCGWCCRPYTRRWSSSSTGAPPDR